jgi:serine protease DegQ
MNTRRTLFWTLMCGAVVSGPEAAAQFTLAREGQDTGTRPTIAPVLADVTPGVVNISVTSSEPAQQNPLLNDPFFRRFFELPEQSEPVPQQSAGSGVIVDAKQGYVLTNHHVAENAQEIVVTLTDRRRLQAKLVGSDPGTDIAVLKVEAEDLHQIPLADSDTLQVGDFVVAIGNPFGLGQTVTSGIVSALGRSGLNAEAYESFVQTDASINPGNSGGALVDLNGELIGINTAIIAPAGGNVGIGFAVPTNIAREVMRQVLEYGEVRRGRLGISIQTVTPDLADALQIEAREGAVVTQIEAASPGERAGLQVGDVIVEFNGDPVTGAADLRTKIGLSRVGSTVTLGVVRQGRRQELQAQIEASAGPLAADTDSQQSLRGAEFRDLEPGHPRYGRIAGVLVARVAPGSAAARSGLEQGDIVTAVNRTAVASVAELTAALQAAGDNTVALNVARGEARIYIVLR